MAKKKKPLFVIAVGMIVFFLLAIITWICVVYRSRPTYLMPDTSEWQTGYIFFSVGNSWESVAVRSLSGAKNFEVSDSTPSHCGLVVRDSDGVRLVHASTVEKMIVAESVRKYLEKNGSYCLYAMKVTPAPDSIAIRHTVDSLLDNHVPFDFDFNHKDPKSLYCTEMVTAVFEQTGRTLFKPLKENTYIYPDDILRICMAQSVASRNQE